MTDHVSLDDIDALDGELNALDARIADLLDVLSLARELRADARARRRELIDRYNAQAARPLVEP